MCTLSQRLSPTRREMKENNMNERRGASSAVVFFFVLLLFSHCKYNLEQRLNTVRSAVCLCVGDQTSTLGEGTPVSLDFPWRTARGMKKKKERKKKTLTNRGGDVSLRGTLKKVTFLNHLVGEVNQIWVRRNVPLSCHLNSYLSSLVALACARVLMIQRGAHSWLTAPHPSVAFSISVRP